MAKEKAGKEPAARTAPARRGGCLHQPGAAGDRGMVPQGEVPQEPARRRG